MVASKTQLEGFTISRSRHTRDWGWRNLWPTDNDDDVKERRGFKSRNAALADARAEQARRLRRDRAQVTTATVGEKRYGTA